MFSHPNLPFDTAVPWWIIVSLRNRFYLKVFVETGAGYGDTSLAAASIFQAVHSIELDPDTHARQRPGLVGAKNAVRHCGSSPDVLKAILPTIDKPILFYIDAHWPGGGPKHGPECPLLDELQVICSRPEVTQDILVVDNASFFLNPAPLPHDPSEWPTLDEIKECVRAVWPTSQLFVFMDVLFISNEPLVLTESSDE